MNKQSGRLWILVFGAVMIVTLCLVHNYGLALPSERGKRMLAVWIAGLSMFTWLMIWILFVSGWRWKRRLVTVALVLLALAGTWLGAIRSVHFDTGLSTPTITWRWQSGEGEQYHREDRR